MQPMQKKKKIIRKLCYNHKKQIDIDIDETGIRKKFKERDAVKRMLPKLIVKNRLQQLQDWLTKIDWLIETVDGDKREEVKKKLLFGDFVSRNLSERVYWLEKERKTSTSLDVKSSSQEKQGSFHSPR